MPLVEHHRRTALEIAAVSSEQQPHADASPTPTAIPVRPPTRSCAEGLEVHFRFCGLIARCSAARLRRPGVDGIDLTGVARVRGRRRILRGKTRRARRRQVKRQPLGASRSTARLVDPWGTRPCATTAARQPHLPGPLRELNPKHTIPISSWSRSSSTASGRRPSARAAYTDAALRRRGFAGSRLFAGRYPHELSGGQRQAGRHRRRSADPSDRRD